MRRIGIGLLVGVAALGSVAAGCGDGDDGGTTSTAVAAIPKQEYLERANAICEDYVEARAEAARPVPNLLPDGPADATPAQLEKAAPALEEINDLTRTLLEDLRALPPSDQDAELFEQEYAAAERGLNEYEVGAAAAADGDAEATAAAYEAGDVEFSEANALGQKTGLSSCG